jgi:hypothetical protein
LLLHGGGGPPRMPGSSSPPTQASAAPSGPQGWPAPAGWRRFTPSC